MPVIAKIVICHDCKYEIRSDWNFCPKCGSKIVCTGKYDVVEEKKTGKK